MILDFCQVNSKIGVVKFLACVSESQITRKTRIIEFRTPKRLCKVCPNRLKRNSSYQTPLRVFRAIRVLRDSDN